MDTALNTIVELLKKEIGLDAATIGESTIHKFLGQRMRACKLDSLEDYCKLLQSNNNEVAALLETAVIPETWFFRDTRPFTIILNALRANPLKYTSSPCNILSIPCSTGEEPYSIAMHLLRESIPANSFRITAVDISKQALAIAEQGYYGKNSFRGRIAPNYIDSFFSFQNGQYLINDNVSQCVSFNRVNILDASTLPYSNHFDFILCRNLLIYFDITTKLVAFNNLHNTLKSDGVLFIGHSEFGAVPKSLFSNTGTDNAFGLIKFKPAPEKTATPKDNINFSTNIPITTQQSIKIKQPSKPYKTIAPETVLIQHEDIEKQQAKIDLLSRAQKLADEGNMADAEECTLQHIEKHGGTPESFFQLALIYESSSKRKMAEEFYRKAIYLDPKHYHSLIHLSLLLESNGDRKSAALLKERAQRTLKNNI